MAAFQSNPKGQPNRVAPFLLLGGIGKLLRPTREVAMNRPSPPLEIRQIGVELLPLYAQVPIAFEVRFVFKVEPIGNGLGQQVGYFQLGSFPGLR